MSPVRPIAAECALLLVDLQIGSVAGVRTMEPARLKDHAIALTSVAQLHGLPVIITAGRKPGLAGVFLPELKLIAAGHVMIERTTTEAFEEHALVDALERTGRKSIICAGVATDIGLLYAVLGARAAGYEVFAVLDASGTTDRTAEDLARLRMVQAGATVTGWASIAAGLMGDFAGPTSLDTMALMAQRMQSAPSPFS